MTTQEQIKIHRKKKTNRDSDLQQETQRAIEVIIRTLKIKNPLKL